MTLTHGLLALVLAMLAFLSVYTAVYYAVIAVFLSSRPKPRTFDRTPRDRVAVLVPALNEGLAGVYCLDSLLEQDHEGRVDVFFLIEDSRDSALPFLRRRFPDADFEQEAPAVIEAVSTRERSVRVVYTGLVRKSDKLNWMVSRVDADYVALLDSDHQARHDWLRTSLCLMHEKKAQIVQGRRWPLSVRGFYRLWDSMQHHVGVQLFNIAYTRLGLNLFFTGTTAVFKTALLKANPFRDCLTEDTDLSYALILRGIRITNNPYSGSNEDLSPDLYTFLSRRRRWANGHTDAFLAHARAAFKDGVPWSTRVHFLLHGQYYAISVLVALFHIVIGGFLWAQFPLGWRVWLAAASLAGGAGVSYFQKTKRPVWKAAEAAVAGAWLFPFVVFAAAAAAYALGAEFHHYLISFPGFRYLKLIGAVSLCAPLLMTLAGLWGFGQLSPALTAWVLLTFPVAIFLDICGNLFGLSDFVFRMNVWRPLARTTHHRLPRLDESSELDIRRSFEARSVAVGTLAALAALALVLANDQIYVGTCGQKEGPLGRSVLPVDDTPLSFYTWAENRPSGKDAVELSVVTVVHSPHVKRPLRLEQYMDGVLLQSRTLERVDEKLVVKSRARLGWSVKEVVTRVRADGFDCSRTDRFATRLIELRDGRLYINHEPFLVKGVIPNFSQGRLDLPFSEGYRLIKELGANTVRFYHAAAAGGRAASAAGLLYIDQPDASTWDNVDVNLTGDREHLMRSYIRLRNASRADPHSLMNLVGNELEAGKDQAVSNRSIKSVLAALQGELPAFEPLAYASNLPNLDFPVNVRAVNMLTTGAHFWERGLESLAAGGVPVLASEFGGFQGVVEMPSDALRLFRITDQWERLQRVGSLGAVFFQSHDNPGQPALHGLADPFSFDLPDDARGLWDRDGHERPAARILKRLYSDVDAQVDWTRPEPRAVLVNRRPYGLEGLSLRVMRGETLLLERALGALAPGARIDAALPAALRGGGEVELRFSYTTHKGLAGASVLPLPTPDPARPVLLNAFAVTGRADESSLEGHIWGEDFLRLAVPPHWTGFLLGERIIVNDKPVHAIPWPHSPLAAVEQPMLRLPGGDWRPYLRPAAFAGPASLRFKLPASPSPDKSLILQGLRSSFVVLKDEAGRLLLRRELPRALPFQEVVIDLRGLSPEGDVLVVEAPFDIPQPGTGEPILMETPVVFAPKTVSVRRVDVTAKK